MLALCQTLASCVLCFLLHNCLSISGLYKLQEWDGAKPWVKAKDSTEETLFQICPHLEFLRLMLRLVITAKA